MEPLKNLELDKICRCCLTVKKEMRPLFGELIAKMLIECAQIQVEETDGWPDKICMQCVHQVSRFHSFKQRLERSDKALRDYIKGLTVVVEEERIPVAQELAMAKIELPPGLAGQQFIARTANGHQVINGAPLLTSSRYPQSMQIPPNTQLVHHNGQLIPVQMLPNNQAQVVQIRRAGDEACELIVQSRPSHIHQHQQQASVRTAEAHGQTHYYEETTGTNDFSCGFNLNHNSNDSVLPATETHDYSKAEDVLEEDEEAEDEEELEEEEDGEEEGYIVEEIQESEYELEIDQQHQNEEELVSDVEIFVDSRGQEVTQEDVVEVNDHENTPASPQKLTDSIEIEFVEDSDGPEETDLMAEFISQQTSCPTPGRHVCKLCQKEFKNSKSLYSHMKLHSNWFKVSAGRDMGHLKQDLTLTDRFLLRPTVSRCPSARCAKKSSKALGC